MYIFAELKLIHLMSSPLFLLDNSFPRGFLGDVDLGHIIPHNLSYKPHTQFSQMQFSRILTFSIYLNENFTEDTLCQQLS